MNFFPVFLSVVYLVRNNNEVLAETLARATAVLSELVADYELIVVDNASTDDSMETLQSLAQPGGLPNLQVYVLAKEVDTATASWVGIENALGDFAAVIDPMLDDIAQLPNMLEYSTGGSDVVFAKNRIRPHETFVYRSAALTFNALYRRFSGVNLSREAPHYRVLSKRVINYILRHPHPAMAYRYLPARGGFKRTILDYSAPPLASNPKRLGENIDRGMRLLVSTTIGPIRLATVLALFGAGANLLYSLYVIAVALLKADTEPGWVSLSLQQSGMFFLISLVLAVLGEYIAQMARTSNEGPLYHIAQEFTSSDIARHQRLNVEEAGGVSSARFE